MAPFYLSGHLYNNYNCSSYLNTTVLFYSLLLTQQIFDWSCLVEINAAAHLLWEHLKTGCNKIHIVAPSLRRKLFTQAEVLKWHSTTHAIALYYLKTGVSHPSKGILGWRGCWWENRERQGHLSRCSDCSNMWSGHVHPQREIRDFVGSETMQEALERSTPAPLTLSSCVIPPSLHHLIYLTAQSCRHSCTYGPKELNTPMH